MKVLIHKHKGKWRIYLNGSFTEDEEVRLKEVDFFIIPELQRRSRDSGEKIPHAFACGYIIPELPLTIDQDKGLLFDYRVNEKDHFFLLESEDKVTSAQYVILGKTENKLFEPK